MTVITLMGGACWLVNEKYVLREINFMIYFCFFFFKDVICCDNCENWFHYKCQNLLKKHITEIRSKKNSFCDDICTSCTKNAAGNFDFEKSIKRLENYSTLGHLEAGARMERILLRHTDSKPRSSRLDFTWLLVQMKKKLWLRH